MTIEKRRAYSPQEVIVKNGGVLPISLSAVYAACKSGEIPSRRIGKRIYITGTVLLNMLGLED